MSDSDSTLIAAFLTKPIRPAILASRKDPLVFARRTRKLDLLASLPPEPEDARLTGATRSLYRRLLALNLAPARRMPVANLAAGPHPDAKIA